MRKRKHPKKERLLCPYVSATWPDQSVTEGDGWNDLEGRLRGSQWSKYSVHGFRREMQRRARLWSGSLVSIGSSEEMFRDLERAGMLRLDVEGEENARHSS